MINLSTVGDLAKLPAAELRTIGLEAVKHAKSANELRTIVATAKALHTYLRSMGITTDAVSVLAEIQHCAQGLLDQYHELLKRKRQERKAEQARWILNARKALNPSEQEPCRICKRYQEICQAHHIMPLYLQYNLGIREPSSVNHEFAWLCPTHHRVVHKCIDASLERKDFDMQGVGAIYSPDEDWELQMIMERFILIYEELWNMINREKRAA